MASISTPRSFGALFLSLESIIIIDAVFNSWTLSWALWLNSGVNKIFASSSIAMLARIAWIPIESASTSSVTLPAPKNKGVVASRFLNS